MQPTPTSTKSEGLWTHHPVMVEEILSLFGTEKACYVDATLGLGGHARAILEKSSPEGRLLGMDRDSEALAIAAARLEPFGNRVQFRHGSFEDLDSVWRSLDWPPVSGILLDLGVSSLQLDRAARGFSFRQDAALDMRMDPSQELCAGDLIEDYSEAELAQLFWEYGEERFSRRIAKAIVEARQKTSITSTTQLRELVARVVPRTSWRIDPATRVFQALRIGVNEELKILSRLLERIPEALAPGGVLVVISYHSLEDRIVKRAFRSLSEVEILTKKPLQPQAEEIRKNPRARSAKLRALRREKP